MDKLIEEYGLDVHKYIAEWKKDATTGKFVVIVISDETGRGFDFGVKCEKAPRLYVLC